jgi:signal transduction histidine kinase
VEGERGGASKKGAFAQLRGLLRNLFVEGADNYDLGSGGQERRYKVLRRFTVLLTALVSLSPLTVITLLSYHQYEKAYRAELFDPIVRLTSTTKQSVDFFLAERRSALDMIIHEKSFEELQDPVELRGVFDNLKRAFGGYVDLGLIDRSGRQRSYAGPYNLAGLEYQDQPWFKEVHQRGVYVSSVFLGHRGFPHFVIAVKYERGEDDWYVLRATVDSEELNRRIRGPGVDAYSDAFLVNREGLLQSPSRLYGRVLDRVPLAIPAESKSAGAVELLDADRHPLVVGYAQIESSPFVFMLINKPLEQVANWHAVRRELLLFYSVSVVLILSVIWWGSTYMIKRIREADHKRAVVLHNVEYTNKMATIGRLAAGVAHEINNPLAIINEKAGLMQDILQVSPDFPQREKVRALAASVIGSVERASRVTHRLLGFARHVEVAREEIDLEELIRDVIGFLGKEAAYRNVRLEVRKEANLPGITSDRGQLEQVFLNIINNALAAVPDNVGRIEIELTLSGEHGVCVKVTDNGVGIERENLSRIFEPFFTTKKGYGTGLGLSVTYGIVKKLGGAITVESEAGKWTAFAVTLPICPPVSLGAGT